MKPAFESLHPSNISSFLIRKFEEKTFAAPYHFHPECELTYIISGSGKRYVGSNMQDFHPGDFVLLGPNLPHCWKSNQPPKEKSSSAVVQFLPSFLGDDFFTKPELQPVYQLLQQSNSGLQFTGDTLVYKNKMATLLNESDNFKRLLFLLHLLQELALTQPYSLLDKQQHPTRLLDTEQQRIHIVTAYIIDNFRNSISLAGAASVINMTPQAFCKYFKRLTRKTFIEAVTDYRIDYAAQQLVQTAHSISQIGFDSGFNDISNFHKTFKARMKRSPLNYRNTFLQKME